MHTIFTSAEWIEREGESKMLNDGTRTLTHTHIRSVDVRAHRIKLD